jgi:DNA ligase-associated metallophosphoesterase
MLAMDWAGQEWNLLAEKALHWPARRAVIVADVHFGKAAAFRHLGVPVPSGTTAHDLDRLASIITRTRCEHLIILGDMLHASHGRHAHTMRAIGSWRQRHASLAITLVRGNHDRAAGDPPDTWRIWCMDEPAIIDAIGLRHVPAARADAALPVIAGHVHPCVRLRDVDGSSTRLPCFAFSDSRATAILPAFGSFTGTHALRPRVGDRLFAIAGDRVFEPARRLSTRAAR